MCSTTYRSTNSGVTAAEVAERLQRYGHNELPVAKPIGFWSMLWDQLNSFVVMLLIAAAAVSGALGEWIDALAILAIVVLNTVLGIVQERRAEQALAALESWPHRKRTCCATAAGR